ncbi:MAG: hypothetical protein Q8K75_09535 [Chlamydiales bacterium]|nr:hypothetical protein [Chlamydiales bacterium]
MSYIVDFFQATFVPRSIFFVLLLLVPLSSCCYRCPTTCLIMPETCDPCVEERRQDALSHWLYNIVPRHRCLIYPWDVGHWITWAFFGNDDDGIFGEEPTANFRRSCRPGLYKAAAWSWRNPCHNFCFYVIGSADRCNSEFTLLRLTPCCKEALVYRPEATTVFAGKGNSLYMALHGGKPFISSRIVWSNTRESRFYLGWRCRGNFGFRFNPFANRKCD